MIRTLIGIAALAISGNAVAADPPVFTHDWSEYPSWSVFGVAEELGLINKDEGEMGSIEEKYNVDIVLRSKDYDTCITLFTSGNSDSTCLTNMDSMAPSLSIPATIVLPTSNSYGADMLIVDDDSVKTIEDLKNVPVRGLELSVSQYLFERGLQVNGFDPIDFEFQNMGPDAAAMALQQDDPDVNAIAVWNPFALQTLNSREGVRVLIDSRAIENEIIDCIVVSNKALERDGGDRYVQALIETFFTVVDRMNGQDRQARDDTLIALGERFSNLGLRDMRQVVRQTRFYNTPQEAIALMSGEEIVETMNLVTDFGYRQSMVSRRPVIEINGATVIGEGDVDLSFDPSHLQTYIDNN
tara:strand:- start:12376 stop:13440 length:1065 start_codon:yes stop_codon:yes gene_type:complete